MRATIKNNDTPDIKPYTIELKIESLDEHRLISNITLLTHSISKALDHLDIPESRITDFLNNIHNTVPDTDDIRVEE